MNGLVDQKANYIHFYEWFRIDILGHYWLGPACSLASIFFAFVALPGVIPYTAHIFILSIEIARGINLVSFYC